MNELSTLIALGICFGATAGALNGLVGNGALGYSNVGSICGGFLGGVVCACLLPPGPIDRASIVLIGLSGYVCADLFDALLSRTPK